jgi:hypothetical protein
MINYTVRTVFRKFDAKLGRTRLFAEFHTIHAESKEQAMTIAWQYVLDEYPYCHFVSQYAII